MTPRLTLAFGAVLLGGVLTSAGDPPPHAAVDRRFVEADRRFRSGSFLRAQRSLEQLEREAAARGDRHAEARALRELGRTSDARGDYAAGQAYRERTLAVARTLPDRALLASILLEESLTAWGQADYEKAGDLARTARALQMASGDASGRSNGALVLGLIEYKRGAYPEAIRLEREALALATRANDSQRQADAHQALGLIFLDLRSFAAAERQFRLRLALVRVLGDPAQVAHALNYSGIVHQSGGDLESALAIHDEAVGVAADSRDEGAWSHALHARGSVHRALGMYDEARADYREAIRLRELAGDPKSRAWSLAGLGRVEKERGQLKEALAAYQGAVSVFAQINDRRALAWHVYEVARLQSELGDKKAARETYERAIGEMNAIELPYACLALADYAFVLAEAGEGVAAIDAGRTSRERAEATGNPEMRWTAAYRNGRILRRLDKREEALASMLDALAIIEGMKPELLPSDAAKSGFFEERQAVFEDAASLLVDLGRPEQALEVAERARSRSFLDLLGGGNTPRPAARIVPEADEEDTESPEPASSGVLRGGANAAPLASPLPPIPSEAALEPPGLAAIREEARIRDAPIVEYFATHDRLLAWLVTPRGEVVPVSSPVGRAELLNDAEAAQGETGGEAARLRLYRRLLEPFEPRLPSDPSRAVLVIPHGPLFHVSLAGLADATGRFVAERHAIAYSPSIGVLRYLRSRAARPEASAGAILVVGNPKMPMGRPGDPPLSALPAADEEAEAVRRAWPEGTVTVLRGDAAGEATVRRLAPRSGLIHLATHGIVRASDPMRSALVLSPGAAGDRAEDGFLTVREIYDLKLTADLVVLSGCDTGLGRINADGVMGLGRAFLFAGATTVVATLWRVADAVARREMELFHLELRDGVPSAEALRRAQVGTLQELRRGAIMLADGTPIAASPAYWAAFVVVGDPR